MGEPKPLYPAATSTAAGSRKGHCPKTDGGGDSTPPYYLTRYQALVRYKYRLYPLLAFRTLEVMSRLPCAIRESAGSCAL